MYRFGLNMEKNHPPCAACQYHKKTCPLEFPTASISGARERKNLEFLQRMHRFGWNIKKKIPACAACQHQRRKCSSECPLAPIFPPNTKEEFEAVYQIFGLGNFTKLMKLAEPHQQDLTADSLITEAKARIEDPILGLTGTMYYLCGQFNDLLSEVAITMQQNEMNRRRSMLQYEHIVAVPTSLLQQLGSFGDFLIPCVPSDKKSCAVCNYRKKKCSQECPFAPFFPLHRKEDFQNVSEVFGAKKFIKLVEKAGPHQHLAAETMINEAIARKSDPVHGLAGTAETLSMQLLDLTLELAAVNQQNKHDVRRVIVLQKQPTTAEEAALSPARLVMPSLTLQHLSSFNNFPSPAPFYTQNDWLSLNFPTSTAASLSVYANHERDSRAKLKYFMDAKQLSVNPILDSNGAIFKYSNNAVDLNESPSQENQGIGGNCIARVKEEPRF